MGVSAEAVRVGRGGLTNDESAFLPTFGLCYLYVGVHEERENWKSLRRRYFPSRAAPACDWNSFRRWGDVPRGDMFPIEKPVLEIQVGSTREAMKRYFTPIRMPQEEDRNSHKRKHATEGERGPVRAL